MIQTQFNCTLKTLRTDHGGEYTSHEFTNYLLHYGISHQFNCPYTPEQNGIAKRKNRHILETTRTLLHFWLDAASTAAYLINRLPTKTLQMQSPYQKLYHQSPFFLHLKTFGCLCYPWTVYSRNHKLEPKSSPCIFLGYSSNNKGFRCLDPNNFKLIISRHVRFHEHIFPMANTSPTTPPPQTSIIHNPISPVLLPTFYPPPTTSQPTPTQLIPPPPTTLPPRTTDTHIQYQRRRPQPTTLPTSTLPPFLPLPALNSPTTHTHRPPPTP